MKLPSHKKMCENIRSVYGAATVSEINEGMKWYMVNHVKITHLASKYRQTDMTVCGVVAALSPSNSWENNLEHAEILINDFKRGLRGNDLPLVGSYGRANVVKSERILLGEAPLDVLGGLKVRAFYECLYNPWNTQHVCVDRHAKSVAIGRRVLDKEATIRPGQYEMLATAYRAVAKEMGIQPLTVQAVTWVAWRNKIAREEV